MTSHTAQASDIVRIAEPSLSKDPDARDSGRRWWLIVPGIVVLVVGLLTLTTAPVGVLHDDAIYVILAKSLATGHGYRYLNLPGEPWATHFPPGYPALLSVLWRIAPSFPANVLLFKIANIVLLVVAFVVLARFLRQQFEASERTAGILAAAATLGIPTLLLTGLVLSEPLFLALVIGGLVLVEKFTAHEVATRRLIGLGLLCGFVALVRSAGIALLGAAVLRLLLSRRYRDAAVTTASALVLLVPWQMWVGAHAHDVPQALQGAYGSYTDWFVEAIRRQGFGLVVTTLGQTTRSSVSFVIDTICPFPAPSIRAIAGGLALTLSAVGAWGAWRFAPALLLFVVAYLCLVLVWPVPPERYIWGMWPLLLLLPALGVVQIVRWRPAPSVWRVSRSALLGCSAAMILGYAVYTANGYRVRMWRNIPLGGGAMLRPVVRTVRSRVGEQETVAVTAEAAVYLYTGRRSVPIYSLAFDPFYRTPGVGVQAAAISAIVSAYPVDVVVASTALQRAAVRRLAVPGGQVFTLRDSTADDLIFARQTP